MKAILHFITSEQFQSFTSQLFSEELPSFQSIEGAGGDGGLDGIEGTTAYQMYFPEVKNRDKKHYVAKMDADLAKLQATMAKQNLTITKWILVVPDDLSTDVVLHLQAKSNELGIECLYWGATKLTALVNKYPYIRNAFPEVFLPHVKQDLAEVKDGVASLNRKQDNFTDIITDDEFFRLRKQLTQEGQANARQMAGRFNGSGAQLASQAVIAETNKKIQALTTKKTTSDRFYKLAEDEINETYGELLTKTRSSFATRGLSSSGLENKALADVEVKRKRELERLRLKYGKNNG
jgi:hypothetical protein